MHGRDLATWPEVPYRPKLLQIAIDYILSSDELIPTHYAVGPATKFTFSSTPAVVTLSGTPPAGVSQRVRGRP